MRVTVRYAVWKRVRHILKCYRAPDTRSSIKGSVIRNYIKLLQPPSTYPRIHFTVLQRRTAKKYIDIEFHVDSDVHTTDIYHPKLEKIKSLFENS